MKPFALFAALVGVLVSVPAHGDVCQSPAYYPPAVTAVIPLYGAGYTGQSANETNQLLAELLKEIQAMRAELQALQNPAAAPAAKGPDVLTLFRANCASCHTGPQAKGDLQLFTDKNEPIALQAPTRREIIKRTGNGTMPPAGKPALTPAEREAIKAALTSAPAKK